MVLHVLFTEEGIPAWFGPEPQPGSEAVEDLGPEFLAAHRRTAKGAWVRRSTPVAADPTPEELAASAEAGYQAACAGRDLALREALMAEADPLFFKWQRGEATKDDWLAAVEAVRARHPKPARG